MRWMAIGATLVMLTVNGLANGLPINGKTTGDIANGFDIAFTPAGYVFAIWGLIYLGVCAFSIVQALPARANEPVVRAVRPWHVVNALANASWIFAWHHERFGLALGLMFVILGSLVAITRAVEGVRGGMLYATVRAPFSLYLGWISVATIANITVVAWTLGATDLLRDPAVTLALVAGASVLCAVVALRRADPIYAAVFVWALIGIAIKNADTPLVYGGALGFAGVCVAVAAVAVVGARRRAA